MSRINNNNFTPGTATVVADLNAKFTDVGTATASINADNVRHEAIDLGNLNYVDKLVVKFASLHEASPAATYTCATAPTAILTPASAFAQRTWSANVDVNRFYWTVQVSAVGGTRIGAATNVAIGKRDATGSLCWLIWPEIATDAGLSNWRVLPDQHNGVGTTAAITGHPDIRADQSPSMMPIPAVLRVDETINDGAKTDYIMPPAGYTTSYTRGYANTTSSDISYYGIRLMIQGVYRGILHPSPVGNPYFDNEQNSTTMGSGEYSTPAELSIQIATASVTNILMAKS